MPFSSRVLTVGVALAFADASIVALALPAIYARFESTIVGVSWVLTGYAVAVTVAAAAIAISRRWVRVRPARLTAAGLVLFCAGSAWCGAAGSLPSLLAGRVTQGIGAAALLSGALGVLGAQVGRERGRRLWSGAATAGLAVGPALGGALTEAFDWRVIFYGQVPVAALVLVALIRAPSTTEEPPDRARTRRAIWANAAYVTLFAGLVGALFLGVLLLVEIWGFSPLRAAAVMTALPAGTLLARPRTANLWIGAAVLAAGLLGLALLPAASAVWAAVALFVCGAGAGLVMRALSEPALPTESAGGAVVAAKHAGLVLGLVIIAPLLSGSLQDGGERAVLAGTGVLLDSRLPVREKFDLALTVRDELADTPRGSVPSVAEVVEAGPAREVAEEADTRLRAVLTRSFRPAFVAAGALALLTILAGVGLRRRGNAWLMPSAVLVVALALVGAEVAAGAPDYGRYAETDPCTAPADPYPGTDVDALVQRVAYGALNGAACELGVSRERFVLALAGQPGFADVRWDTPTVERAVRAAAERAIEDADSRDDLPGWMATLARETVRRMPIGKLLELLGLTDD